MSKYEFPTFQQYSSKLRAKIFLYYYFSSTWNGKTFNNNYVVFSRRNKLSKAHTNTSRGGENIVTISVATEMTGHITQCKWKWTWKSKSEKTNTCTKRISHFKYYSPTKKNLDYAFYFTYYSHSSKWPLRSIITDYAHAPISEYKEIVQTHFQRSSHAKEKNPPPSTFTVN